VTELAIITGLILLNGLFVAAEFAIVGAPRAAIDTRASRGDRLARLVQSVLRDPQKQDRYIATAQLGITIASLGLGMYGEHVLADAVYNWLDASGLPALVLSHGMASVIAVAILTYFHIVVGEMVPKSLALQKAERLVLWITPPMLWIKNVLYPFVVALNGLGNQLLKIVGVDRKVQTAERYHTPEELQLIVQESEDLGALRAESGQVLQELFEFGERIAGEVMVPRVKICGIPIGTPPARIREVLGRMPHTRYPIYEGDLDHIVGIIHIKDLLRLLLNDEAIASSHARQVPMLPETASIDSILGVMRSDRTQMVVVIDEHGGTAGILTLEDLFEEVIGDIDESPAGAPQVYRDRQSRLRVPGTMRLDEVGKLFDLDLEHEDVDSVSGLILTLLGRPPVIGDSVRYDRLRFDVTGVKGHGVEEAAVTMFKA
jgi:CBS domain containing-hemolysin-like protein